MAGVQPLPLSYTIGRWQRVEFGSNGFADEVTDSPTVLDVLPGDGGPTVVGLHTLGGAGREAFRDEVVGPRAVPFALLVTVDWTLGDETGANLAVVPPSLDSARIFEALSNLYRAQDSSTDGGGATIEGLDGWGGAPALISASTECPVNACSFSAVGVDSDPGCGVQVSSVAACEDSECALSVDWIGYCGRPIVTSDEAGFAVVPGPFGFAWGSGRIEVGVECACGLPPEDGDGDGWSIDDGDCDDSDDEIFPGASEACDTVDSDCDGDLVDGETDLDGDSLPDCIDEDADGDSFTPGEGDCDDNDPAVFPGAPEACDVVDSDCDGDLVESDTDLDGDGLPDCVDDDVDGDGSPAIEDCDDGDAAAFPGAPEACDLLDADCNGSLVDGAPDFDFVDPHASPPQRTGATGADLRPRHPHPGGAGRPGLEPSGPGALAADRVWPVGRSQGRSPSRAVSVQGHVGGRPGLRDRRPRDDIGRGDPARGRVPEHRDRLV